MKPNEQETRELFRAYVINTRPLYSGMATPARLLAANLRAAIATVNKEHAPEIDGAALIDTDADKRAAIDVYINEIREVLEWELIGQYNTREPGHTPRYRVEENAGTVTVWDALTGYGFRFKKGDALAQYTLTILRPDNKPSTPEELANLQAAADLFTQWAAHRFPAEFGAEIH